MYNKGFPKIMKKNFRYLSENDCTMLKDLEEKPVDVKNPVVHFFGG